MAENIPPTTSAAANGTPGATAGPNAANQASTRGLPYYEKLRRELRDTINKKRQLDKALASLEISIYNFEQSYLEETGAGNIVKGFDNYIKGASTTSNLSASGSGVGGSFGGGGGSNARKRAQVADVDRVFSRSSLSFMRDSPTPSSTTPSVAPTPTYSGHGKDNSTGKAGNSKKKKSGGSRAAAEDADDTDGGPKPPTKRLKITYSRGGTD